MVKHKPVSVKINKESRLWIPNQNPYVQPWPAQCVLFQLFFEASLSWNKSPPLSLMFQTHGHAYTLASYPSNIPFLALRSFVHLVVKSVDSKHFLSYVCVLCELLDIQCWKQVTCLDSGWVGVIIPPASKLEPLITVLIC